MIPANKHLRPIAIWGFAQIVFLGIGASGFPLWSHHPFPRESLTLPVLLCGQTLFIAILFPKLVSGIWTLALGLILMIPMDELAGLLSNSAQPIIFTGFACVGVWMVGLAGWGWLLKDPPKQLVIVGAATLLSIGGAILDYLRWEASALGGSTSFRPVSLLAKLCGLTVSGTGAPWVVMAFPLILCLTTIGFLHLRHRNQKSSSTSLHQGS